MVFCKTRFIPLVLLLIHSCKKQLGKQGRFLCGDLLGDWDRGGWRGGGGGSNGLGHVWLLLLWLADLDDIGVGGLGADLASWVMRQHDLDLEANNTLTEEDVANGGVDVLGHGETGVDHQTVSELHCLGTLTT